MSLLLLAAMVASEPGPPQGIWLGNDVIAASDGKVIFARGKAGVEALDVTSGKPIWSNEGASRLAGISGNRVFGWVGDEKKPNSFRVVTMDAKTGKTLFTSEAISMPDWATTAKQGGRSFRTAASSDGESIVVVWQANSFYFGGARPTPEIEAAARKEAVGVVSLDANTGKAKVLDRKPRGDEFGEFKNKAGGLEFQTEEQIPGFKPNAPMVTKITLSALKDGKVVWTRELAGNPWSPPPP